MTGDVKITEEQWDTFLHTLSTTSNVSDSAKKAGISRRNAYNRRKSDPKFAARWDEAMENMEELVRDVVVDEAVTGTPIFDEDGKLIGSRRNSRLLDRLAVKLGVLDSERPTTAVQVNNTNVAPAGRLPPATTDDDLRAAALQLARDLGALEAPITIEAIPVIDTDEVEI